MATFSRRLPELGRWGEGDSPIPPYYWSKGLESTIICLLDYPPFGFEQSPVATFCILKRNKILPL